MLGIGFHEFLVILLLMVIFIKPKDIPSVVNYITGILKSIRQFIFEMHNQIKRITNEIDNTTENIDKTFHDRIEKLRLEIDQEPDFFDLEDSKKIPKLKIEKQQKNAKKTKK